MDTREEKTIPYTPEYCSRTGEFFYQKMNLPWEKVREAEDRYKICIPFLPPQGRGIDVACGIGLGTRVLARHSQHVIGIEIVPERIAQAKDLCADTANIEWRQCNLDLVADDTPLVSPPIDYVVTFETAEHVVKPEKLLESIHASLHPGGLLLLTVPVSQTMDINPFHLHDFTETSITALVKKSGFDITHVEKTQERPQALCWGNPFRKSGRVLPQLFPTSFLLRNAARVYWQSPYKLFHRITTTIRERRFPLERIFLVATKVSNPKDVSRICA